MYRYKIKITAISTFLFILILGQFHALSAQSGDALKDMIIQQYTQERGHPPKFEPIIDTISEADGWIFGIAAVPTEEVNTFPEDFLFLAQPSSGNGWSVALEGTDFFFQWADLAPSALLTDEMRRTTFTSNIAEPQGDGSWLLSLPWPVNTQQYLTGGPHNGTSGTGTPWNSLNFSFGAGSAIAAAREGSVYKSCSNALIRLDHGGGRFTRYYFAANATTKSYVVRGEQIGTQSTNTGGCGPAPTGANVLFGLYTGSGTTTVNIVGMDIGGWTVESNGAEFNGCLRRISDNYRVCTTGSSPGGPITNTGLIGSGPLNAPTGLTVTSVTSSQTAIRWTDSNPTETNYLIEQRLGGSPWAQIASVGANSTTYTASGLTCGAGYQYRVRAYRSTDSAYSSYSSTVSATTLLCAPQNLSVSPVSQTRALLTWTDSTQENRYYIERNPNSAGAAQWGVIGEVGENVTQYLDYTIDCKETAATYTYRIRARRDSDGVYSSYSNQAQVIMDPCVFEPPLLIAPADGSEQRPVNPLVFEWSAVGNVTWYQVKLFDSLGNPIPIPGSKLTPAEAQCANDSICAFTLSTDVLTGYDTYKWFVRVLDGTETEKVKSNAWYFDWVPYYEPVLLAPLSDITESDGYITYQWVRDPEVTKYWLRVKSSTASPWLNVLLDDLSTICQGGICSYTPAQSDLQWIHNNDVYEWDVRAGGELGKTRWSSSAIYTLNVPVPDSPALASPAPDAVSPTDWIVFTWNTVANAHDYRIKVNGTEISERFNKHLYCDTNTCTYALDQQLLNGPYSWFVVAFGPGGASEKSEVRSLQVNAPLPAAFALLKPDNDPTYSSFVSAIWPVFRWQVSNHADIYIIQLYDIKKGEIVWKQKLNKADVATYCDEVKCVLDSQPTFPGLQDNREYRWKVIARNFQGKTKSENWWFYADLIPGDIIALFPVVVPGGVGVDTPVFRWKYDSRLDSYRITIRKNSPTGNIVHAIPWTPANDPDLDCSEEFNDCIYPSIPQGILKDQVTYYWIVQGRRSFIDDVVKSSWNDFYINLSALAPLDVTFSDGRIMWSDDVYKRNAVYRVIVMENGVTVSSADFDTTAVCAEMACTVDLQSLNLPQSANPERYYQIVIEAINMLGTDLSPAVPVYLKQD